MAEEKMQTKSKERSFRGKSLEELQSIDTREFAKLVKSRPRRALLRNYDRIEKFISRMEERSRKNRPIRTHGRALIVVPRMVGKTIHIHNGKEFVKTLITHEMLGHRLGEFAVTRKPVKHGAAGIGATKSSAAQSVK